MILTKAGEMIVGDTGKENIRGSVYKGVWVEGDRHGFGVRKWSEGTESMAG